MKFLGKADDWMDCGKKMLTVETKWQNFRLRKRKMSISTKASAKLRLSLIIPAVFYW